MADREEASQRRKSSKTKRRRTKSQRNARRKILQEKLKQHKIPPTEFPLKSILKIPLPLIKSENLKRKEHHAKDRTNKIAPEKGLHTPEIKQCIEIKEVSPKNARNRKISTRPPAASDYYVYKHEFIEVVGEKILHEAGLKMYRLEWNEIDAIKWEMSHLLIFQCGGGCFVQGEKEMLEARKTFPTVNKLTVVSICIDNGDDHFSRCVNGQQRRRYNVLHVEFHSMSSGDLHKCLCNGENYHVLTKLDSTDFKQIRSGLNLSSIKVAVVETRIIQAKQAIEEHRKRLKRLELLKEDVTKTVGDIKTEGVETEVTVDRMKTTLKKLKKSSTRKKENREHMLQKNKGLEALEAREIEEFVHLKGPTKPLPGEIEEFTSMKDRTKPPPVTVTSRLKRGCCKQMCVLL